MSTQLVTDELEAKEQQRQASKRATFDRLVKKPRVEREVSLNLPTGEGKYEQVTFKYRSLGAQEYDQLMDAHPPTTEQKVDGASFNIDTFAASLISKVCVEPSLTYEECKTIWDSPDWNRGELMHLFSEAMNICNSVQQKVPFTVND